MLDRCADWDGVGAAYPFLKGVDFSHPPPNIAIPRKDLDAMGNMERQYWEIKAKYYNVLIFFKKGKFYELYDNDAVVASREFGLKLTIDTGSRGKMRLAGIPEQSFSEWARLFVYRGFRVGRVEQLHVGDADGVDKLHKAKVIPRELVEVLTPGTITDPAMLSNHKIVFLLAVSPALHHLGIIDCFAVDMSRRVVHWCPCGNGSVIQALSMNGKLGVFRQKEAAFIMESRAVCGSQGCLWPEEALRALSTLLQQLDPREVIIAEEAQRTEELLTVKGLNSASEFLCTWIEGEGFSVDRIPIPTLPLPDRDTPCVNSPARILMDAYFRMLRKEREQPLLDEARLYRAHLSTVGHAQVGINIVGGEGRHRDLSDTFVQKSTLLSWERRYDSGLVLDAATIRNLEIVANQQDGSELHSLYQELNHCFTNGGRRLFREWMLRPASEAAVIRGRQDVVRFLVEDGLHSEVWVDNSTLDKSSTEAAHLNAFGQESASQWGSQHDLFFSSSLPEFSTPSKMAYKRTRSVSMSTYPHLFGVDLERNLSRLAEIKTDQGTNISYVDPMVHYRKNLTIVASTVKAFRQLIDWSHYFDSVCRTRRPAEAAPKLLNELLYDIRAAAPAVCEAEGLFDERSVREDGLLIPLRGTSDEYDRAVDALASVEAKLHETRRKVQQDLFANATVSFSDLGKDLFLLEVASVDAPKLTPRGLVERARSAKNIKYSMEALGPLVEAHREATISKSMALHGVLCHVAAQINKYFPALYVASSAFSYFDCLVSLATLSSRYPKMCFPTVFVPLCNDGAGSHHDMGANSMQAGDMQQAAAGTSAFIRASDLVHPVLVSENAVPNSVVLDDEAGRLLVLTGPNMAGKSTFMRTVAVNVILAQMGGPVLGSAMAFSPIHRIFTRIGAHDASHKGQSTLYVELTETAEILRNADGRSLCLIDELGRGTSTHDGLAIAHASLQALKEDVRPSPLTIFSTHYHALAFEQERFDRMSNLKRYIHSQNSSCNAFSTDENKKVQLGYMDFALSGAFSSDSREVVVSDSSRTSDANHGTDTVSRHVIPTPTFLYRLVPGICARSYGVEVAVMAGVAPHLLHLAKRKSKELARFTALHEDINTIQNFLSQPHVMQSDCES